MLERIKPIAEAIASVPDHIWALTIVATGSGLTIAHQQSTGQALIAAGLAMWKGKQ